MPQHEALIHGWISNNCGRGTIDIIWSCLFTIFICAWTALHLGIPQYNGKWPLTFREKLVRSKIIPTLLCVIAPEIISVMAIGEFYDAHWVAKSLTRSLGKPISPTKAFFLNGGGFSLRSSSGEHLQVAVYTVTQALESLPNDQMLATSRENVQSVNKIGAVEDHDSERPDPGNSRSRYAMNLIAQNQDGLRMSFKSPI